jgi:hypothetical protein
MVRIKTGMSRGHFPRLPLIFINIIISLFVISLGSFFIENENIFGLQDQILWDGGSTSLSLKSSLKMVYLWYLLKDTSFKFLMWTFQTKYFVTTDAHLPSSCLLGTPHHERNQQQSLLVKLYYSRCRQSGRRAAVA